MKRCRVEVQKAVDGSRTAKFELCFSQGNLIINFLLRMMSDVIFRCILR